MTPIILTITYVKILLTKILDTKHHGASASAMARMVLRYLNSAYRFENKTATSFLGILDQNKSAASILCLNVFRSTSNDARDTLLTEVNA